MDFRRDATYKFPLSYRDPTPFADYTVPGLILMILVGGSALVATWAMVENPAAGSLAYLLAGVIMVGWIVGEFILVPAVRVDLPEPPVTSGRALYSGA